MSQQRLSSTRWYMISACVGAWGAVLGALCDGVAGDRVNLIAIIAASMTGVVALLLSRRRVERVFMHGYHAGYHEASKAQCEFPQPCDVLMLSEERAKRAL